MGSTATQHLSIFLRRFIYMYILRHLIKNQKFHYISEYSKYLLLITCRNLCVILAWPFECCQYLNGTSSVGSGTSVLPPKWVFLKLSSTNNPELTLALYFYELDDRLLDGLEAPPWSICP